MTSTLKRNATLALVALASVATAAAPASAKDNYKGYNWNKFTSANQEKDSSRRTAVSEGDNCSSYWTKWKNTGDNEWRGRYYACVYGGH